MKPIQVGLLGMGTVGSGTFNVLQRNQEEIKRRAGRGIEISMVADLDVAKAQALCGDQVKVVNDARQVIANPDIDVAPVFPPDVLMGGARLAQLGGSLYFVLMGRLSPLDGVGVRDIGIARSKIYSAVHGVVDPTFGYVR